MKKIEKCLVALFFVVLSGVAVFEGPSTAWVVTRSDRIPAREQATQFAPERKARDLARIIGVLESRIKNHHLPEKAINKLAAMDDKELRLIKSLCDRMDRAGDTAGADFAFLLVTAAIVTS